MRMGSFSFSPGLVTTLAAAACLALFISLGRWQVGRGEEKQARQSLYEARSREPAVVLTGSVPTPEPLMYRHVRAAGTWIAEAQFFVDNHVVGTRAGFHVITPLRLEGRDEAVLVNRGWIARDARYPRAPEVAVPAGRVVVSGLATRPPARYRELSSQTVSGNVWQNLSIERYATHSRLALLPIVMLADAPAPGLTVVRETPDAGVAKHQEYALTWFALAATTLALWLGLNLHRRP
jgi:surfeit locus 1 family protein